MVLRSAHEAVEDMGYMDRRAMEYMSVDYDASMRSVNVEGDTMQTI